MFSILGLGPASLKQPEIQFDDDQIQPFPAKLAYKFHVILNFKFKFFKIT